MAKKRILFISQEIAPYSPGGAIAKLGNALPGAMHGRQYEVRTFMPRYGSVNERRNQLHEVIRLSGMNIIIDDNDHPLILKVASLQPARIQVYFIDNDDYFQKLDDDIDFVGSNRADNDERAIFFARGTVETIKKLRWEPNVIQCAGWITSLNPIYLRRMFEQDPAFANTKVVYTPLAEELHAPLDKELLRKLEEDGIAPELLEPFRDLAPDTNLLHKLAINFSDAVIFTEEPPKELLDYVTEKNLPYRIFPLEDYDAQQYLDFYNSISEEED